MSQTRFESRNGRKVVLKPLDDDCLLDDVLHPTIRLRLDRVRELPVPAVANLHGVERSDGRPYLVWDYIEGAPLSDVVERLTDDQRAVIRREISLAVKALHAAGVVHGAIHERNVIVDPCGLVRLTHVSPLLYDDPQVDRHALDEMFDRLKFNDTEPKHLFTHDQKLRVRVVLAASLVLLAGAALAALIGWYAGESS